MKTYYLLTTIRVFQGNALLQRKNESTCENNDSKAPTIIIRFTSLKLISNLFQTPQILKDFLIFFLTLLLILTKSSFQVISQSNYINLTQILQITLRNLPLKRKKLKILKNPLRVHSSSSPNKFLHENPNSMVAFTCNQTNLKSFMKKFEGENEKKQVLLQG